MIKSLLKRSNKFHNSFVKIFNKKVRKSIFANILLFSCTTISAISIFVLNRYGIIFINHRVYIYLYILTCVVIFLFFNGYFVYSMIIDILMITLYIYLLIETQKYDLILNILFITYFFMHAMNNLIEDIRKKK